MWASIETKQKTEKKVIQVIYDNFEQEKKNNDANFI